MARREPSHCGIMPLLSSSGCCSAARCAPCYLSTWPCWGNARAGGELGNSPAEIGSRPAWFHVQAREIVIGLSTIFCSFGPASRYPHLARLGQSLSCCCILCAHQGVIPARCVMQVLMVNKVHKFLFSASAADGAIAWTQLSQIYNSANKLSYRCIDEFQKPWPCLSVHNAPFDVNLEHRWQSYGIWC